MVLQQPLFSTSGTYAGQFIMGGFLNLRLKKWLRALITRSCAIVPTIIVALVFNRSEASLDVLNEWLNVLQSVQIPFALIPLLTLVSNEQIMGVFKIEPTLQVSLKLTFCHFSACEYCFGGLFHNMLYYKI